MGKNLFGEITCTPGHEKQCRHAMGDECKCSCGGHNHGKDNPDRRK